VVRAARSAPGWNIDGAAGETWNEWFGEAKATPW